MKVLIIGAGKQGAFCDIAGTGCEHKVISHAKAFKMHDNFDLIGFYDKDITAMKKAAIEWDTGWFASLEDAFENDISIVSICTPDSTHYEVLKEVLQFHPQLVLCEKPIATDINQAEEIVAEYKDAGIPILVNYTRRFIPQFQVLKNSIRNDEFGNFLWGSGVFNRGWAHTATHMVDFVFWLLEGCNTGEFTVKEVKGADYRIFRIDLFFENLHWQIQSGGEVDPIFDLHMRYVVDNIYKHLTVGEPLRCTSEDALWALKACFILQERANGR